MRRYSPAASAINTSAANTLDPFAIRPGFPGLGPLTSGPPPHPTGNSRQRTSPADRRNTDRRGTRGMVPTFTFQPFDRVGVQLCPPNLATACPQTFTVASRPATSTGQRVPHTTSAVRVCVAPRPRSARFEPLGLLRSFRTLVPHVHLSVSLAGPGPSGSTDPSRRCQGCFPPKPPVPEDSGCPQLHVPATTDTRRWPPTTARLVSASWRSMSPTQATSGAEAPKSPPRRSGTR